MRKTLQAILAIVLAAAPASAGTVYIPVVAPDGDGGQKVVVIATNNDPTTVRRFSGYLLGIATDGVAMPRSAAIHREVQPLQTVLVEFDAKQVSSLLEINAAPQLDISARLENVQVGGEKLSIQLPVVSSYNMVPPGTRQRLHGWRRASDGTRSNFGVINVGKAEARCTLEVLGTNGQSFGSALLSLAPLSMAHYSDALGLLGITSVADAHARLECDQPTFPWVEVYNATTASFRYIQNAASGKSTLQLPGQEPPPAPVPEGAVVFTKPGAFHTSAHANPTALYDIEVGPHRTFGKLTVSFDYTHNSWYPGRESREHNLFWLHRGGTGPNWIGWLKNIFGYANIHGPNQNRMRNIWGVDTLEVLAAYTNAVVQLGRTYRVVYTYEGAAGAWDYSLTDKVTGQLIGRVTGFAGAPIRSEGTGLFFIYMGHGPHCEECPEVPSFGSVWSDLRVEFLP